MNLFKRNQVVITALVIMIAIAGYLNFTQRNIPGPDDDMIPIDNPLEPGAVVPNSDGDIEATFEELAEGETKEGEDQEADDTQETSTSDSETSQPGEAIFTSNPIDVNNFFISQRLSREQQRARENESYLAIINSTNLTEEQKKEATTEMINLQQRIEKEAAAEDLLKSKGFNGYVRIVPDSDTVTVVIDKKDLSETETAQINDIIKRTTGFEYDKIIIDPLKIQQ